MKSFEYVITSSVGIHARPAGVLVKEASRYACDILVNAHGQSSSAKKLFALMKLGAKCNDTILVTAEGSDEDAAIAAIIEILKKSF